MTYTMHFDLSTEGTPPPFDIERHHPIDGDWDYALSVLGHALKSHIEHGATITDLKYNGSVYYIGLRYKSVSCCNRPCCNETYFYGLSLQEVH